MKKYTPIRAIAIYTFIEALKNRLFALMIIGLICIFGLTMFMGELAITETSEIRIAITGYTVRLFAVFITSLFVITTLVREFNDKSFELIISLPVPRHAYFFGKLYGFVILTITVVVIASLPVFVFADFSNAMIWSFSLVMEILIITVLCLLCLFTLGQITTAFSAVVAFYLLARSIGTIQLISHSPILESASFSQMFITKLVNAIAYVIPDLGSFTRTEWLVYHTGSLHELMMIAAQSLVYILLLSAAALFDLYRKEF